MPDQKTLVRQWLLLRRLCRHNSQWTLEELAAEYTVAQRTIRRDISDLSNVGFPLTEQIGPHGKKSWACETDCLLSKLCFTFEEAASLYLGRRFLEPMAGTVFFDAAHSAFRKIESGFSKKTLEYLEQLASTFHQTSLGVSNYQDRGDTINALLTAIEDQRVTNLLYYSMRSEAPGDVILHPYGLVYHRASLYLVAFVSEYNELRHYKIDRVHDTELVPGEYFEKPDEFELGEHLQGSFGIYQKNAHPHKIRVRFNSEVARYVGEHHWHTTQTLTQQSDGSLLLELELSALEEFKAWVLSFGAKAVVEEPEELRTMIAEDLQEMRRVYQCVR